MATAIQESSRRLEGEDISRYCPSSDYAVMFVGISSSGEDLSGDAVAYYAVHSGQLLLVDLEDKMFATLAEATFAEDWDSEADSIYDNL